MSHFKLLDVLILVFALLVGVGIGVGVSRSAAPPATRTATVETTGAVSSAADAKPAGLTPQQRGELIARCYAAAASAKGVSLVPGETVSGSPKACLEQISSLP